MQKKSFYYAVKENLEQNLFIFKEKMLKVHHVNS